jgi:putative peptide zinc metalloprotease protein
MFEDVDGVKTYQVEDPETGESFSFGEEEFFLCQSMNGRTSAEEILAAFRERFGMEMRPEHFHDFEEHLLSMRLAVPAPAASSTEAPAEKAGSDREASPDPEGSSGWKLFNPERLLIRLEELTRPLLPLVRLSLLALIPAFPAALYVIFRYGVEFRVELVSVSAQLGYLGGLLFTLLTANFARCVVQGIVCAHFGLAPKAFGIRLLRGILPRFYIGKEQVRGQDRRTKLWIYGTSILVRIYLVVLGTLVWALFKNSPTLIPSFGVMIVQAGLIGLVIQLLPFQTTDGFRWLVNYFHLPPNMIVVAITVLTARLTGRELPDTLRGWRGGRYLLYALLLVTALTFGLIMVVNHIASGLARSFPDLFGRATPYILVVVVAFLMVRWGVGKVMHRARRRSRSTKTDDGVLDDLPEGEDLSGDGFLRKHRGWIIAGVLVLMMFVPFAYRPGGEIQVLPPLQQQIQAPVSGKVAEVFFEGGDGKLIPKGTVVAKMISSEIENALLTLEQSRSQQLATIDRAKSELAKLLSGARSEEITAAKAKLDQAVEQVSVAMQELESAKVSAAYSAMVLPRMQQLYRSGSIALLQYEEAKKAADIDKINVQKAEKNLASLLKVRDEAQAQLDLLKSGARPEDIASARHTVEAAQADLARIEQQIQYARQQQTESALLMPFEGYLVDSHLDFKRGAYLKVGDVYATAQNNSDPLVEVQLPEYDMEGVEVGATAQVKLYAYPNSSLTGKVLSIQPAALPSASGGQPSPAETSARIFRLLIEVDKPPFSLKAGMTGYAKINAGYQPLGLLLARPILRFVQIEMWSWLP